MLKRLERFPGHCRRRRPVVARPPLPKTVSPHAVERIGTTGVLQSQGKALSLVCSGVSREGRVRDLAESDRILRQRRVRKRVQIGGTAAKVNEGNDDNSDYED